MSNFWKVLLTLSTFIVVIGTASFAFGILSSFDGGPVSASISFISVNSYGQYWFDVPGYFLNIKTALVNFIANFVEMGKDFCEGIAKDFVGTDNVINYIILAVNTLIMLVNILIYPLRLTALILGLTLAILGWDLSSTSWFVRAVEFLSVDAINFIPYV